MFVAFAGHYALRTRILSSVACPGAQYKRWISVKKKEVFEHKMCFLIFCTNFV